MRTGDWRELKPEEMIAPADSAHALTFSYGACSACGVVPEDHTYGLYIQEVGGERTVLCEGCTKTLVAMLLDMLKAKLQPADSEAQP